MSTYYLAVHTQTDYTLDDYPEAAGKLAAMVTQILAQKETLAAMSGDFEKAYSEVEVALEPRPGGRELVGKAVIEFDTQLKFDKGKFSKAVKASPLAGEWPDLKIAKRELSRVNC